MHVCSYCGHYGDGELAAVGRESGFDEFEALVLC